MQRNLANSDKRQSVPLNAASFLSGFLNRPKISLGNISPAVKIYPFATGLQQDCNLSPDRAELDVLGMNLDDFWPIQATLVVGKPVCDVGTANSGCFVAGGGAL